MQKKSCRHLLSYSPCDSTRREVNPRVHLGPPFGGRGGRRRSAMIPFETALVVPYTIGSRDRCAISDYRNLPSNVSDAQINRGGPSWGTIWGEKGWPIYAKF